MSPPLRCFRNEYAPPLMLADDSLDLIWAASVFTHIGDLWADWLLELHRVLAAEGLLIASFLGEGMWEARVREPYRDDEVGMTVVGHWRGPGADVLHSEWWLRAHWGRAFEVLEVARPERDSDGSARAAHSWIVLRKRPGSFTVEQLEEVDPGESRELAALRTSCEYSVTSSPPSRAGLHCAPWPRSDFATSSVNRRSAGRRGGSAGACPDAGEPGRSSQALRAR